MKFSSWIVVGAIVLILGIWTAGSYNGFISSRQSVDTAWAKVESQYQRRFDLIPNLVATVKGAANFEQTTLTQVVEARSAWAQGATTGSRDQQIQAAGNLESALSRLLVTVEAYPTLTATEGYKNLMVELVGTENRIAVARNDYNDAVRFYNVKVQSLPGNLFASLFGFKVEKSFIAQPGAESAPNVDFTK